MWRRFVIVFMLCCCLIVCFSQTTDKSRRETTKDVAKSCASKTKDVELVEGESESLRCDEIRKRTSDRAVRWYAGDTEKQLTFLHITGDTLNIHNVSRSCVPKMYRCESLVSGTSICNQTFQTNVVGPPSLYIYEEEDMIKSEEHEQFLEIALKRSSTQYGIVCSVDSNPPSYIKWYEPKRHGHDDMTMGFLSSNAKKAEKDKKFMNTGDSYRFRFEEHIKDNVLSTRELVMKIQVGEASTYNKTYTCFAENKYGSDSWSVKIVEDTS